MQFNAFVRSNLLFVQKEYHEALMKIGYNDDEDNRDYFVGGWSKANEIKAWYLYERFRGTTYREIESYLPFHLTDFQPHRHAAEPN